jgi:hypothetical protein
MPYKKTPNRGGVYKVWVTPVERFAGDPEMVDNPDYFHGFIPAWSKTDNYKVKRQQIIEGRIDIHKFHDKNVNCLRDDPEIEEEITGWEVLVTDPLGVTNVYYTPVSIIVTAGTYTVEEEIKENTFQTTAILDGETLSCIPAAEPTVDIEVAGVKDETHELWYGNGDIIDIEACKFYDRNGDGINDDEPPIPGWKFSLTGVDLLGNVVGPILMTAGESGCVLYEDLLPGVYQVEEIIPPASTWEPTGDPVVEVTAESDIQPDGSVPPNIIVVEFGNVCYGEAAFSTKGYWHNKNGLNELNSNPGRFQSVLEFVNGLDPYDGPSGYYDKGDEPFNGEYADGSPVPAAKGVLENEDIAAAGTVEAEISNFLIGSVGDGGIREQLAEQLLAFIFNAYYRLDHPGAVIELPSGDKASAMSIIEAAVAAWAGTDSDEQQAITEILDGFNNSTAISFVRFFPCEVSYP